MSKTHTREVHKSKRDKAEEGMTIKVPNAKERNPFAIFQERKQVMGDRRTKRAKDARNHWSRDED